MDLFEYMKQQLGCNFTSDLHYHQQEVLCLFQKTDCSQYSTRELDDFCQYVFKMDYKDFQKHERLSNYYD